MMLWAWVWSIQIGTWRRPLGSLSRTIGVRLAASRAIPATLISTMAALRLYPIMTSGNRSGAEPCSQGWFRQWGGFSDGGMVC